jgi:hypothetical protein
MQQKYMNGISKVRCEMSEKQQRAGPVRTAVIPATREVRPAAQAVLRSPGCKAKCKQRGWSAVPSSRKNKYNKRSIRRLVLYWV